MSLTLMFQKEVADRIVADVDTDAYGRLAVLAQWRTRARIAMPVHRSAFTPPPKVMSAVVHIIPAEHPPGVELAVLERLTAAAFGQRRKMLRSALSGLLGSSAAASEALVAAGVDPQARGEMLQVTDFARIAEQVAHLAADPDPDADQR